MKQSKFKVNVKVKHVESLSINTNFTFTPKAVARLRKKKGIISFIHQGRTNHEFFFILVMDIPQTSEHLTRRPKRVNEKCPKRAARKNVASIATTRVCTLTLHGISSRGKIGSHRCEHNINTQKQICYICTSRMYFDPI